MKVLIVGNNKNGAIELYYYKYLKDFGVDIALFPIAVMVDAYIKQHFYKKVLRKLGFTFIYRKFNRVLLNEIQQSKPDIVWIFKGVEIVPETLEAIKNQNIKIVNYNPDHPFKRTFSSHGGKNIEISVPFYDLHFCYSHELCLEIRQRFNIPTVYLPFGFELSEDEFDMIKNIPETQKVGFIGNPDKERVRIIKLLASNKIPVDVYGYGWNKWLKNDAFITIYNGIEGIDFWKAVRKYRVNINIFRPHNVGSHNMRTFEIPACGGIMLAPESMEHSEFFEVGKSIFNYFNDEDLVAKCKFILELPKEEADKIRRFAREASVSNDYSYKANTQIVFKTFQSLN